MRLCNAVFEGGGVRGIGHVGAACVFEKAGYQFADLAGSSAGAIVAALLAAGYGCGELKREMEMLNYRQLKGKGLSDYFGAVGKSISILFTLGIYNTDYLEKWVGGLLKRKGMETFQDVRRGGRTLKITVSDLTEKRLLILPDDLGEYGVDPDSFPIASAVRMSASIPVFFEPVRWKDGYGKRHLIVDGGLLSNYPIWELDNGTAVLKRPTFGFKFQDVKEASCGLSCPASPNIAEYLKAILSTCLDAYDNSHITSGDFERTVRIPTQVGDGKRSRKISAVDFDLSREDSRALFENGRRAAEKFLKTWNFAEWKSRYR